MTIEIIFNYDHLLGDTTLLGYTVICSPKVCVFTCFCRK